MTNQEAIEAIIANYPSENYTILREALDMAIILLKEQETIVRCKDCKFAKKSVHRSKEDEYKCILSEFEGLYDYHNKDWFCADGEKGEVE